MDRRTSTVLVVAVIVVALALAALLGTTSEHSGTGAVEALAFESIPTDGSAIVSGRSQVGGFEILGIRIQAPEYWIDVALAVPEECIDDDGTGTRTLLAAGACAQLPISGPIGGGGRTASGHRIATVRVAVDEDCFEAILIGAAWPPTEDACAGA